MDPDSCDEGLLFRTGLGLGAIAALCFVGAKSSGSSAEYLRSFLRVGELRELARILGDVPVKIAVSGTVGSDKPIKGEYSGKMAILVEVMEEQHFIRYIPKDEDGAESESNKKERRVVCRHGHRVIERHGHDCDCKEERGHSVMATRRKMGPWHLEDGTGRVEVTAAAASQLPLWGAGEIFEDYKEHVEKGWTVTPRTDYLPGYKMLGVKRIELISPVGSFLTVIGEVHELPAYQ